MHCCTRDLLAMGDAPVPEEIEASEQCFDFCFHPTADFLAAGLVDGAVELYQYGLGAQANKLVMKCKHSEEGGSCRGILFNPTGTVLYAISSDRSLQVIDHRGQLTKSYENSHKDAVNKLFHLTDNILATGCDSGEVKIWDVRTEQGEVMSWHLHEDFVSGFAFSEEKSTLLSVAGDATLCAYDLRSAANTFRSDDQEAELQCVEIIKGGRKIACGTQDGILLIFSWDKWGDCSDRYPGHPESLDCLLKLDEATLLTGSSDGLIRCVTVQPNNMLGVIGDHEDFPVEQIRRDRLGRLLGSISHDNVVRFWDISMFADDVMDADEDGKVGDDDDDDDEDDDEDEEGGDMEAGDDAGEGDEDGAETGVDDDGDAQAAIMADDGNSTPFDSGSDDDDDDDSDAGGSSRQPAGGRRTLKTASEKFYKDL